VKNRYALTAGSQENVDMKAQSVVRYPKMDISEIREKLQDIRSYIWTDHREDALRATDRLLEEIEKEELK
jgi:hypothetical protein